MEWVAISRWTLICKVMSLLFNMPSRLVTNTKQERKNKKRNLKKYLFILTVLGHCCHVQVFSSCGEWGLLSSSGWCLGFWILRLPLLQSTDSKGHAGFSSCSTQAWLPRSMWDLPEPRRILNHWTTRMPEKGNLV